MTADTASALSHFRAALLADEAPQLDLAPIVEPTAFIARAIAQAAACSIALTSDALAPLFRHDPLGLSRFDGAPLTLDCAPPRHWLPADIVAGPDGPLIDWLHFAGAPLSHPFYQDSARRARALPFNRLMRVATPLSALDAFAGAPPPDGFIFHMSRCGSTLVAQMLAAVSGHITVSEPPPLDTIIQLAGRGAVPPTTIRTMIAALTRDRRGDAHRRFVKLDSWHSLALPMLRTLYPDVPWVFLYRDPVEVLVSQARMPGVHAVPGMIPLDAFGVTPDPVVDHNDYAAWLLDLICKAALDAVGQGAPGQSRGLLVNYRQLPDAMDELILPHFGITPDPSERAAMAAVSGKNSKAPDTGFATDSAAKQREADPTLRAAADRHLAATYAALENVRQSPSSAAAIRAAAAS